MKCCKNAECFLNWETEAFRGCEYNDGEDGGRFFQDTSVTISPVVYWYSSGNNRRYIFGKTPLRPLFSK